MRFHLCVEFCTCCQYQMQNLTHNWHINVLLHNILQFTLFSWFCECNYNNYELKFFNISGIFVFQNNGGIRAETRRPGYRLRGRVVCNNKTNLKLDAVIAKLMTFGHPTARLPEARNKYFVRFCRWVYSWLETDFNHIYLFRLENQSHYYVLWTSTSISA